MFSLILQTYIFFTTLMWVSPTLATSLPQSPSIGDFASSMMEPVGIVNKFINTASIMLGTMCLLSAFLRYMQYRVNRVASPLSTVMVMLILGLVLLALPFVYIVTGQNPFSQN